MIMTLMITYCHLLPLCWSKVPFLKTELSTLMLFNINATCWWHGSATVMVLKIGLAGKAREILGQSISLLAREAYRTSDRFDLTLDNYWYACVPGTCICCSPVMSCFLWKTGSSTQKPTLCLSCTWEISLCQAARTSDRGAPIGWRSPPLCPSICL